MKRSADAADVTTVLHEFQIADQLLDSVSKIAKMLLVTWSLKYTVVHGCGPIVPERLECYTYTPASTIFYQLLVL